MHGLNRTLGHANMFLYFLFAFLTVPDLSFSKLLAGFVHPHGGIALDPKYFNTTNHTAKHEAWEIHNACTRIGQIVISLAPDIIFLSTPHGISDLNNFVFYLNPTGAGYADTDNCQCPPCCYKVNASLDSRRSEEIVSEFGTARNVSGLSGYGPPGGSDVPFPLRWGEVIPLYFIPSLEKVKVVILSQPSRRYTKDVEMIPELLQLGGDLYRYLEALSERVVVIVSADLAHTHLKDGPYGFSNTSEPFDLAIGIWASTLDGQALLKTAAGLVDRALSCGYTGLVMLHGLLEAASLSSWVPKVFANYHPSYYGYAQLFANT
ncbi:uncharacterized protein LOC121381246 isoform X2 [Gigantopelta aegis]|uniref:uncharacterized protein LOC121381246 isoform X2 n=1 Tax=Gigantopelta aegis TaxID=1735272 RepID=UPI001B88CABB|nr:uncharacterized protein LOC121381246 isoform X2 [Gigantopelta aegis]